MSRVAQNTEAQLPLKETQGIKRLGSIGVQGLRLNLGFRVCRLRVSWFKFWGGGIPDLAELFRSSGVVLTTGS